MAQITREKAMEVSAQALYTAITDFESYPNFLPEVLAAKIESKKGPTVRTTFELEILKRFEYTLEFLCEKEKVSWTLIKSNLFKKNKGAWVLKPAGKNTHVTYELDLELGFLVPGWVSKKLTEVNLPTMLEAFEKRAQQISKASP